MTNKEFYDLIKNVDLGKTKCPQCGIDIHHKKGKKIKFCGMCDYEFKEVKDE